MPNKTARVSKRVNEPARTSQKSPRPNAATAQKPKTKDRPRAGGDQARSAISAAAAAMGRVRSERKTASSRANAQRPRPNRQGKPLQDIPCNCNAPANSISPQDHKSLCPRGRAIRYRIKNNKPLV